MAALIPGTTALRRLRTRVPDATVEATRDQVRVASGQLAAGLGNMAFALVAARLLAPGSFAELASFLALYTVLSLPGSSISAAAAMAPRRAATMARTMLVGGVVLGAGLAVSAPWTGHALRLPPAMVVVLGLSGPVLGTLALERGRLYGLRDHGRLVASLVMEPTVRLSIGVALAMAFGAVGGAAGITLAGYGALETARRRRATTDVVAGPSDASLGAVTWIMAAFVLLVIVQNQDLLIANRVLSPTDAGRFAVVSTLGGIAAFATLTTPLVLLPRTSGRQAGGLMPALGVTALVGAAAVTACAVSPGRLVVSLFGARYASVAPIVVPYVSGMALLGVTRVLVAHRCARADARAAPLVVLAGMAALAQALAIVGYGHSPRAVAFATLGTTSGLTATLGALELMRLPTARRITNPLRVALTRPVTLVMSGALAAGLGLRLAVPRGLWLDEATSVFQARMGFGAMIANLRTTDVHPPLYFSVLWATVRGLGSGEMAVRTPSIVAGTLVIPMLYVLGKEAYDRRTGVVAALCGVVAPILVWYSQEARMYALLTLFSVTALWAQVRILKRSSPWPWAVYSLASVALGWTQYFGLLQVVAQQLVFLGAMWGRRADPAARRPLMIGWALSLAVVGAALAPLVPFAHQQFVVNQTGGHGFGGPSQVGSATTINGNRLGIYAALANLIWAVWGYHSNAAMALLAALWPLGMLVAVGLLGRQRRGVTSMLVAAVVIPGVALFCLGLVKRDLFDIRYLSTTVPPLFILLSRSVTGVVRSTRALVLVSAVLVGSLGAGLVDQQLNGSNPRLYDFRGAVADVNEHAHRGDELVFVPGSISQVVAYYKPRAASSPLNSGAVPSARRHSVFVIASKALFNSSTDADGLSVELAKLRSEAPLVRRDSLSNVEVWQFR
jgi:hypothetical protein